MKTTKSKTVQRHPRGTSRSRPKAKAAAPPPAPPAVSPPAPETAEREIALAVPEPNFAAGVPLPPPERAMPATRRAVFFDVENTSRAEHLARVMEHLAVDRLGRRVDVIAVGNWKVVGHDTARLLARYGAQ